MPRPIRALLLAALLSVASTGTAGAETPQTVHQTLDRLVEAAMPQVVTWRRDFHQHPELSNREFRTATVLAERLRAMGLDVRTGIAHTGVVAVLRGGKPGPTIALRADMDALPVTEALDLPFRSTARAEYNCREFGVMHACGHDAHMAILLGAAQVLSAMRAELPGTVTFIFQPAEEGPPAGEDGGARLMIEQGVLDGVEAIFGLHVFSSYETGTIAVRPRGIMAASDSLTITVRGRQTHGALPWEGTDPIVAASQIVTALQTVVSRQTEITKAPAIVTIGSFQAGNRGNIIPDEATLVGTIRTFDPDMQREIHLRITRLAEHVAQSAGATANVAIEIGNPVTFNDPALTARMAPSLARVAERFEPDTQVTTTAEDFSRYQEKVPGLFFFLGVTPKDADPAAVAANHSPRFFLDEAALVTGVRAMASLAIDYLYTAR
jgi:amidohydrolase